MLTFTPKLNLNGNVGVNAHVSNSADGGQKGRRNFEYGGQLFFSNDMWRAKAGYLLYDKGANNRHLMDIQLGATYRMVALDLNGTFHKDFTDTNDKWGMGLMAQAVFTAHEKVDLNALYEFGKKLKNAYSANQFMVGPTMHLNDEIDVKANYSWTKIKAVSGGTETTSHEMIAAGVYKF